MERGFDTDVLIVGAGEVGWAIARELTRFDLRVTLIEAGPDVGAGTSKANTAILHTGFDAKPGTLESRLVARGHELLGRYAERVGIPVERTGALLVAWNEEQLAEFPGIVERRAANGYDRPASSQSKSSTGASRTSVPGPAAPSRSPTSASSAPSPRRWPSPPRPWPPAATFAATRPVDGAERLDGEGCAYERRPRRAGPRASSSTPPACVRTSSTGCSATTDSRSRRGAAS